MSDTKLGSALPWNYGIPPEECKGLPLLAWGKNCGFELTDGMSLRNAMISGRSPWSKWLDPQAAVPEWRSIETEPPGDGDHVLFCSQNGCIGTGYYLNEDKYSWRGCVWMPLPAAPEREKQ